MTRTTVNLDDALLHRAAQVFGTEGVSATINAALAAAVRQAALASFDVRAFDIQDADIAAARADRT